MDSDAFSKRHPLVNLVFFLGAIGFGVVIQHPAYLAAGVVCAGGYYLLLMGRKGWKLILGLVPLFLILTLVNPLFNTYGATVLFDLFGRPYTLEGLYYGAAVSAILVIMFLWFGCYNVVLTSDKFTALFGNFIPALSLLLVMVLRLIPNLVRKAAQFAGARKSIGKGAGDNATRREKLLDGMTIVSALTDWALEGSVVTGDSMRSRGYGSGKRTSFMIYRMTGLDAALLAVQLALIGVIAAGCLMGSVEAAFIPTLCLTPVAGDFVWGYAAYWLYLTIPVVFHFEEALRWHISKSKI